jgi:hypothetical protein
MIFLTTVIVVSEILLGVVLFFYVIVFFIKIAIKLLFKSHHNEKQPVNMDYKNIKLR